MSVQPLGVVWAKKPRLTIMFAIRCPALLSAASERSRGSPAADRSAFSRHLIAEDTARRFDGAGFADPLGQTALPATPVAWAVAGLADPKPQPTSSATATS